MQMVNLTIDGKQIQAPAGSSVLEAARSAGIYIPTLCYHPDLRPEGACRLCMVEASGARTLVASCVYPVSEGMVVKTNTSKVREARKTVLELLLTNHPKDCRRTVTASCRKLPLIWACVSCASRVAKQERVLLITAIRHWYAIRKNAFSAAVVSVSAVMCRV